MSRSLTSSSGCSCAKRTLLHEADEVHDCPCQTLQVQTCNMPAGTMRLMTHTLPGMYRHLAAMKRQRLERAKQRLQRGSLWRTFHAWQYDFPRRDRTVLMQRRVCSAAGFHLYVLPTRPTDMHRSCPS